MLPVGWLVIAVFVAVVLTMWVTFTLTRLDRLHARVDAAWAALDAQLVRRSAGLLSVAESPENGLDDAHRVRCEAVARASLNSTDSEERHRAENAVGRAIGDLVESAALLPVEAQAELTETAARVLIARRFYNDAVRDTRALRVRRMPRLLRLAGRRAMPQFFDIDDTVPNPVEPLPETDGPSPRSVPDPAKESP